MSNMGEICQCGHSKYDHLTSGECWGAIGGHLCPCEKFTVLSPEIGELVEIIKGKLSSMNSALLSFEYYDLAKAIIKAGWHKQQKRGKDNK